MIELINKTIYSKETQQAIKELNEGPISKDAYDNEDIKTATIRMIEALDGYLNIVNKSKGLDKSFEMCGVTAMRLMIEDILNDYLEELPNLMRQTLQQIVDKLDNK